MTVDLQGLPQPICGPLGNSDTQSSVQFHSLLSSENSFRKSAVLAYGPARLHPLQLERDTKHFRRSIIDSRLYWIGAWTRSSRQRKKGSSYFDCKDVVATRQRVDSTVGDVGPGPYQHRRSRLEFLGKLKPLCCWAPAIRIRDRLCTQHIASKIFTGGSVRIFQTDPCVECAGAFPLTTLLGVCSTDVSLAYLFADWRETEGEGARLFGYAQIDPSHLLFNHSA